MIFMIKFLSIASFIFVSLFVLWIYSPTIQRGIPGGDSGELVAEACDLGVAHPPGYPLYVLLSRAAIEVLKPSNFGLPPTSLFSSQAYRVNAFSALLGALSAGLVYISTTSLLGRVSGKSLHVVARHLIAASTAISFALSPLVWMYSVGAEVFVLNNFFIALLLMMFVHYSECAIEFSRSALNESSVDRKNEVTRLGISKLQRITCLASFVCGLALCNQHTSILLIVPMVLWVAWSQLQFPIFDTMNKPSRYSLLTLSSIASYALSLLMGLAPYIHMPVAHSFWRNRGSWGDTTTIKGFIHHFLRADYGTLRLFARDDETAEGLIDRTRAYINDLDNDQFPTSFIYITACFLGLGGGAYLGLVQMCNTRDVHALNQGIVWKRTEKKSSTIRRDLPNDQPISPEDSDFSQSLCCVAATSSGYPLAISFFFIFYFAVFHTLSNMPLVDPLLFAVHQRFWMQPNLFAFVLSAEGFALLSRWIFDSITKRFSGLTSQISISLSLVVSFSALYTCFTQYDRNHVKSDLSSVVVMEEYARSLLSPLPRHSVLITSYDMQWTSVRYLQSCEGYRRDVQVFNGPTMSYPWFSSYRQLYDNVRFPGTHLAGHLTLTHAQGAFSLADFFAVNLATDCGARLMDSYARSPPHEAWKNASHAIIYGNVTSPAKISGKLRKCRHSHGGIFHAGGLVFAKDDAHTHQFDFIPHGIVNRVIFKRSTGAVNLNSWRNITVMKSASGGRSTSAHVFGAEYLLTTEDIEGAIAAYANASFYFNGNVNVTKHDNKTWELATRIDFWQQTVSYATWLLEWALDARFHQQGKRGSVGDGGEGPMNIGTVLRAASLLEKAVLAQIEQNSTVLPNTWKNLGLAYMKVVRSSDPIPAAIIGHLPRLPSIGDKSIKMDISTWKKFAAERVLETWGKFMTLPEAAKDSGYASIAHVVTVLREASESETRTLSKTESSSTSDEINDDSESITLRKPIEGSGRGAAPIRPRNAEEEESVEIDPSSGRIFETEFDEYEDTW